MSSELSTKIEGRIDKSVSAATGLTDTGAMAFASVEQIMEFAKVMAIASVAVPKHLRENVGACLAVAIQASEWQMSPFAVANKSYVVNDRIAYEAQMVNAVILRRAPIVGRFKISYSGEGAKRRCKVAVTLTDGDVVDYESPEFATIPVKNSPLWKGDPDQQLFYYSSRAMCRRHFPDVLLGVYTPDELGEAIDVTATVREIPQARVGQIKIADVVEPKPEPAPAKTVTEMAAEEAAANSGGGTDDGREIPIEPGREPAEKKPAETPAPKPPKESGPSAEMLRADILKYAKNHSVQKNVLTAALVERKYLIEGETMDALSATKAADVLDQLTEIIDGIKNPNASA